MVPSSTSRRHSSASGWTRIRPIVKRASFANSATSSSTPDSFRTSTLIERSSPGSADAHRATVSSPTFDDGGGSGRPTVVGGGGPGRRAGLVFVVGTDDLADEAVPDDVLGRQEVEADVL